MRLISIKLLNFRQFYGQTPEIFLASGEQNTTIIHGNNGAGKTTLMNAFTWVLYEKFSAAFAAPDQLVNKRAITEVAPGRSVNCSVEVTFEHDQKRHHVKRLCRAYRNETGIYHTESQLFMQIAGTDGEWFHPSQQPEDIIGRILPESLHQYFFFDGERIEQIVRSDNKAKIAEATRELLGVEVISRAIYHLGIARKSLEGDLRLIGDPETKKLIRDKEKIEQEIEQLQQRQVEITGELSHQADLKKTISNRLLEFGGSEELERLRNELKIKKESIQEQLKQANDSLKKAISGRSYKIFLPEIAADFREFINNLRLRGELPTAIKRPFLEELLQRGRCICGAELHAGTHTHAQVQAWMDKAGMADIEETAIRMSAKVDDIDKQVPGFWQEIDRHQANNSQNRIELSRIETQIEDIDKKLRNFPEEDIQQLQKRLDEIEAKISEINRETGANKQQIENLKTQVERLAKQIDKHQMNEIKQVLAQRRIAATQDAIERLTEVKYRLDQQFRLQLEKRVQEIFSEISFTPYIPKVSEKYELTLVENTSGQAELVAASTGENQILSLSFIAGIIDGVRHWRQKNTLMGPDSSTFPIVMDSPFGSLDEIYRRQIAKVLPKLANQLVVLVTKTQWRGEVEAEMAARIGKEYILTYYSPKPDCEEDAIELEGVVYPLVKQSPNEFEYTEIVEVDYAF